MLQRYRRLEGELKVFHEEDVAIDTTLGSHTGLDSLHSLWIVMPPFIQLLDIPSLVKVGHRLAVRLQQQIQHVSIGPATA